MTNKLIPLGKTAIKISGLFACLMVLQINPVLAQKWVDTLFQIHTETNIEYGIAIDFGGNNRSLTMDINYPVDDTIPECGRPLMVLVHGGSFLGGSKEDPLLKQLMLDFAKRGYFTANINYRLGMFQTENEVHCNVTNLFNTPWDCSNMADTAEWYRGNFRGMQDTKGAIRFLVNQAEAYHIDPHQIFLVGESAGGFIAMQSAFLDLEIEKNSANYSINDVLPPNDIYNSTCIQNLGFDTSIASLTLERPDLGSISGELNPSNIPYAIKGVGNFYGGMMQNYFIENGYEKPPVLYLFHQPNDLVVPFNNAKVLAGLNTFFSNTFGCANILNRPQVYGSAGIKFWIDSLAQTGAIVPEYYIDFTNNNADAFTQFLNPATNGHSVQDYWLHSGRMATFFAKEIETDSCLSSGIEPLTAEDDWIIYPNPATHSFTIQNQEKEFIEQIIICNELGQIILRKYFDKIDGDLFVQLPEHISQGNYWIQIKSKSRFETKQLIRK